MFTLIKKDQTKALIKGEIWKKKIQKCKKQRKQGFVVQLRQPKKPKEKKYKRQRQLGFIVQSWKPNKPNL